MIDPKKLVRKEVADLPAFKVGVKYEEFAKQNPDLELIRLGSNENPFGPSPKVLEAIQESLNVVHLYPDNTCTEITEAMAAKLDVSPGRIIFGTGAETIMLWLANDCLRSGDKVVSFIPTFPFIDIASHINGAEFVGIAHEDDLSFSADKFCEAVQGDVRMVYLCMPNNPTGSYFTGPELEAIVSAANPEALFVLDEAYVEFAGDKEDYPDAIKILETAEQPYISLRTMSKAYALAGMRIGYGIAYCEEFAAMVKRAGTVFNIGVLTQKAALAALSDDAHTQKILDAISSEKRRVEQQLKQEGVRFFNSAGNFICVSLPTLTQARHIESEMQKVGIFIKGQKGRGEEGVLRITIGRPEDNDRMLENLRPLIA